MSGALGIDSLRRTERLAARVLGGSVVFFIGAGFSLDSEGNSAGRLISRLLARLLAIGTCLARDHGGEHSQARPLLEGLGRVFGLAGATDPAGELLQPVRCMTWENVNKLTREYYNFNEWSVSAFGVLAREMLDLDAGQRRRIATEVEELENFLLRAYGNDRVPLVPVDWDALAALARDADRGKALFLDTMGFADQRVMGGEPAAADLDHVAGSFRGKLRPRHHALARLAREGLLPYLVTTNYDLLLEGAYRLAGFVAKNEAAVAGDELPETAVPHYARIAAADQFLARGDHYRTALLLKIHGCVDAYRDARGQGGAAWAKYLPALVFTYREIQTWRADAWSRDLMRTLLRTQTLALCGYSGADPILHSTFREVYEEMAAMRARPHPGESGDAPAFFFDVAGKREFHGFEILRAATEAAGYPHGRLIEHPNHVEFQIGERLPSLDDHFRWLYHCVTRSLQERALQTQLRRLAPRLLGHVCRDRDFERLGARFQELRRSEDESLRRGGDPRLVRRRFEAITGWTWHFLPGLLRELALAERVESQQGPGEHVRGLRRSPWYYPASQRPEWTAWAAVLELGLRSMVAAWRGEAAVDDWLAAEDSPHAAVSYARGEGERQPYALAIRLAGFERPGRSPELAGAFKRLHSWEFSEQDLPWRVNGTPHCPGAAAIWNAALGEIADHEQNNRYLGVVDEH
ncbi:MAG: hypothetical protein E6Q43_03145 [Dokdonella sp.]|nr:MAG: hypothetical protein E6Q43_03145 [Dokdonella sp.]